jgi:hypothetical protein
MALLRIVTDPIHAILDLWVEDLAQRDVLWALLSAPLFSIANYLQAPKLGWIAFGFYFRPSNPSHLVWTLVSFALCCWDAYKEPIPTIAIFCICLLIDVLLTGRYFTIIAFSAMLYLIDHLEIFSSFPAVHVPVHVIILSCILALHVALGPNFGGTYTNLPEDLQGALFAVVLLSSEVLLPPRYDWLTYGLTTLYVRSPYPSWLDLEWAAVSYTVWTYGLSSGHAFGINLLLNTNIHPRLRQLLYGVQPSSLLERLQNGAFTYGLLYVAVDYLRRYAISWLFWLFVAILIIFVSLLSASFVLMIRETNHFSIDRPPPPTRTFYTHGDLPHSLSFRVLRIHPSVSTTKPIHCEMLLVSLESGSYPPYIGISYAWDRDVSVMETIFINNQPFKVSPNVYAILKAMRHPLWSRCVWIDSICINQKDNAEKASQVRNMRQIYQRTTRVVGWLGEDNREWPNFWLGALNVATELFFNPMSAEDDLAFAMVRRLNSSTFLQDYRDQRSPSVYFDQHRKKFWDAFRILVTNRFFTRIWIVQEVVTARHVFLRYGRHEFSWELYARAISILCHTGLRENLIQNGDGTEESRRAEARGIDNTMVMENIRQRHDRPGIMQTRPGRLLPLEDTLKLCAMFSATEDVDRIFALLGVISDAETLRIDPDYDRAKEDIFTDTSRALMTARNAHRIIRYAGIGHARKLSALPSWVPDWTTATDTCVLSHWQPLYDFRASSDRMASPSFLGESTARFSGIIVDTIKSLAEISPNIPVDSQEGRDIFRDALQLLQGIPWYGPTNQSTDEAFWRTTVADSEPRRRPISREALDTWIDMWRTYQSPIMGQNVALHDEIRTLRIAVQAMAAEDKMFSHMLTSELAHSNHDQEDDFTSILGQSYANRALAEIPLFMFGRKFCLTEKGYIGLVPAGSIIGDRIGIFSGASTPHVLRRVNEKTQISSNVFQLVAECYMHGMMDGEMWRDGGGPVPIDLV